MEISASLANLLGLAPDNMIYVVIMFVLGLFFIVKGGDIFVDAATWIAEATGIPKFIIGATVVSFATTLPELLVSAIAAAKGQNDMAIGHGKCGFNYEHFRFVYARARQTQGNCL